MTEIRPTAWCVSLALAGLTMGSAANAQAPAPAVTPLTLQSALQQARANSLLFRAADTAAQLASEDRKQARAALLPSVSEFSQVIYTQSNDTPSGVFVSNDGPKIYNTWLTVHGDLFSPGKWAEYRSAGAAEAVARARADIASRGLVLTVVQSFYGLVAAERKAVSAERSLREAEQFLDITQKQERGGEAAHSDVVKAQIQVSQRVRDNQEAALTVLKNRLGLSVLVFPDFRDTVAVADDMEEVAPLPPLAGVTEAATAASPEVKAAEASVQVGRFDVQAARGALLPSVSFDYFYGINANQFAATGPDGERLLGSVVQAQLEVPLWNWGAAQSKKRQAELRAQQARAELTLAQRQLLANVRGFHSEADVARSQVASLRDSVDLATESLRLTLLRYQSGDASVLDVVDAQTTLLEARNAYDEGLVRYRVALATLQTLTGVL